MSEKKLAVTMLAGFVSFAVSLAISFFLSPYLIRTVGVEALGFVSLATNFTSYASLLTIALNSMAGRFITIKIHKNDFEGANRYFNSVFIANGIMAAVLILPSVYTVIFLKKIVNIPADMITDVQVLFALTFANFFISILVANFGIATFTRNKLYLGSLRGIESKIIHSLILIILFVYFIPRVSYLGIASLVSTIYVTLFNIKYTANLLPEIRISKKYFDFGAIKELVSSGIWNTFSKLSSIFSTGLDLLIANLFVSAAAMGTLSISKTLPTFILSLFSMMSGAFSPELTESYAKGDMLSIKKQLLSSIKLLGMLASIPTAILFVYGDRFYGLWVPTEDARILQLLSIAGCAGFVFALPLEGLWNIFSVTNKVKVSSIYLFVNSTATIIFVLISINFVESSTIRVFIVAGVSSIFSIIRALTFLPLYGAKCLGFKWDIFYSSIIKNTISVMLITALSFVVKQIIVINSWMMLFIACLITGVIGLVLNYFLILEREERQTLFNFAKGGVNVQYGQNT